LIGLTGVYGSNERGSGIDALLKSNSMMNESAIVTMLRDNGYAAVRADVASFLLKVKMKEM
jgi:hypothetical protein